MKTVDQTTDEILNLVAAEFKIPRGNLQPTDDFYEKLGIDSEAARDLLYLLENHFSVEIPDVELQEVTDFKTLASRIQARL